jgi:hypothetical protein
MGLSLRDLLSAIGAEIERHRPPVMPDGTLQWIGRLTQAPRPLVDEGITDGWEIWTSGPGWIPLEHLDLERWQVDINSGKHLVVCEREEIGDISIETSISTEIVLWGPKEYAAFVGRAVLLGLVTLQSDAPLTDGVAENRVGRTGVDGESVGERGGSGGDRAAGHGSDRAHSGEHSRADDHGTGSETETSATLLPMPPAGLDLALAPVIDVQKLMLERGRSGISLRPLMFEAALWVVESNLVGPNQEIEPSRWWIIEDPLVGECSTCGHVDFLRQVPGVEVMAAQTSLDDARMRSRLSSLLDIRRAEELSKGGDEVPHSTPEKIVTGGLLRWWRVDSRDAILTRRRLLLPAWVGTMPIDGVRIVHGMTGQEYAYQG